MRAWKGLKIGETVMYRGLNWELEKKCRVSEKKKNVIIVRDLVNNSPYWLDEETKHEFMKGRE